ncbi:hypothetical protein TNCT_282091 [Trichonephila clavata]|uniref:Uncharacterized protein n=1 Tax=Trichonephila clavata TaxID=2740835 RepID=A0A8X6IBR8_TRICU|nr:hypothetical protein TNCT_282091 [Trichonephila clavata]
MINVEFFHLKIREFQNVYFQEKEERPITVDIVTTQLLKQQILRDICSVTLDFSGKVLKKCLQKFEENEEKCTSLISALM